MQQPSKSPTSKLQTATSQRLKLENALKRVRDEIARLPVDSAERRAHMETEKQILQHIANVTVMEQTLMAEQSGLSSSTAPKDSASGTPSSGPTDSLGLAKRASTPTPTATSATTIPSSGTSRVTVPPKSALGQSSADTNPSSTQPILGKRKLQDLVAQIDPHQRVDNDVQEMLMELADEFIESTTAFACQLAKHRKSKTLEVKDVQLYLESHYQMRIPGFFSTSNESIDISIAKRKPVAVHAHQARLAAVKKALYDESARREKSREKNKEKDAGGP